MRYEDWDILLFPKDCKVPIKEFKVACHVVHDAEFAHSHGSSGLPTVCCFVPSLQPGDPFQISIHSWAESPSVSKFTKSCTDFPELVKFEARLFVDGRLMSSSCFGQTTMWPHVIAHSFEFSKTGDLEPLKFPPFRQELLQQNFWNAADDLGRIKIVISEGFPRDSFSLPTERVKNVVAFSFQHAPLDILESSAIAWPNSMMWRRTPFPSSMPLSSSHYEDSDSHAHSPRRRVMQPMGSPRGTFPPFQAASMNNTYGKERHLYDPNFNDMSLMPNFQGKINDSFNYVDWMGAPNSAAAAELGLKQKPFRKSSTDTSMPDYMPAESNTGFGSNIWSDGGNFPDPETGDMKSLKAPSKTPTGRTHSNLDPDDQGASFPSYSYGGSIPADLAHSLTYSLLNHPPPNRSHQQAGNLPTTEVRSRKEVRAQDLENDSPSTLSSISTCAHEHRELRKVSAQMRIATGRSLPSGTAPSQVNSPQLMPGNKGLETGQRTSSLGDCGENLAVDPSPESALRVVSGNSEKGTKRTRSFTPMSAKAPNEEDEPPGDNPHIRVSPFVEDGTGCALE